MTNTPGVPDHAAPSSRRHTTGHPDSCPECVRRDELAALPRHALAEPPSAEPVPYLASEAEVAEVVAEAMRIGGVERADVRPDLLAGLDSATGWWSTVERKVRAGAVMAVAASVAAAGLSYLSEHLEALSGLPGWLPVAVTIAAPPLAAALGGYAARHTPRPDLEG